jgi:hypothetical protein
MTDARSGISGGFTVNHQSLELGVWLGIAVLALIWANLHLWRARRLVSQLRQDDGVPHDTLSSSAAADKTSSVIAS